MAKILIPEAQSGKAEHEASPCRSAMSMLIFYINRGGNGLSGSRKTTLEKAKDELREL
jgi:hypothetical protein